MFANMGIQLIIALHIHTRRDFVSPEIVECLLAEYLACQANAVAEVRKVFLMAHIVELNLRWRDRVGGCQRNPSARL